MTTRPATTRKSYGMRAIGAELAKIAGPVLKKQGLGEAKLLTEWVSVIGSDLARDSWPVKLSFPRGQRREGTLRLKVSAPRALEFQHREPQILERLNAFFGYPAIARIVLIQVPPPHENPLPAARPLAPEEAAALTARLGPVPHEGLRDALARLGKEILGRTEGARTDKLASKRDRP